MAKSLQDPHLDSRLRHPNWFHGRLLSATDLKDESSANQSGHQMLGRAVGPGVVEGLWVEKSDATSLSISGGLAIAPDGTILSLQNATGALAVSAVTTELAAEAGEFATCGDQVMAANWNGEGPYLLVMSSYSQLSKETAPRSDLRNLGTLDGCDARYTEEGVQFRLVPYYPASLTSLMTADNRLRNRLAYFMMGYHLTLGPITDAQTALRNAKLMADGEIAIAMLLWQGGQIQFIDNWSIRRRPVHRREQIAKATPVVGPDDQQIALGEAMQWQLQEQYQALGAAVNGSVATVADYFDLLPAGGVLSVPTGSAALAWGMRFFAPLGGAEWPAGSEWIRPKLHEAMLMPPLKVAAQNNPVPTNGEVKLATQVALAPTPDGKYLAFFRYLYQVPEEPQVEPEPEGATLIIKVAAKSDDLLSRTLTKLGETELNPRVLLRSANGTEQELKAGKTGAFTVRELTAGTYIIRATAKGAAESRLKVTLADGDEREVEILLVAGGRSRSGPARTLRPTGTRFTMPTVLPEAIDQVQANEIPEWQETTGLAPSIRPWLIQWSDQLASEDKDLEVYPPDLRILVDPKWSPTAAARKIYAVAELGPEVYLPIMLTQSSSVMTTPMVIGELDLPLRSKRVNQFLTKWEIDDLDVAANLPYETLGAMASLESEEAEVLVLLLREELDRLKQEPTATDGTLVAPMEAILVAEGYSYQEVAYSKPDEVVRILGEKGVTITESVAGALINRAQFKITTK